MIASRGVVMIADDSTAHEPTGAEKAAVPAAVSAGLCRPPTPSAQAWRCPRIHPSCRRVAHSS